MMMAHEVTTPNIMSYLTANHKHHQQGPQLPTKQGHPYLVPKLPYLVNTLRHTVKATRWRILMKRWESFSPHSTRYDSKIFTVLQSCWNCWMIWMFIFINSNFSNRNQRCPNCRWTNQIWIGALRDISYVTSFLLSKGLDVAYCNAPF